MAFGRWLGWAREMVRVLRGLPDEEIRRQTAAMREELIRLRRHRAIHEKEREAAALRDIRRIVEEMQSLERNLEQAEKATVDYVDTLAEQVTKQMEEKLNAEMDHIVSTAMTSETADLKKLAPSASVETHKLEHPTKNVKQESSGS